MKVETLGIIPEGTTLEAALSLTLNRKPERIDTSSAIGDAAMIACVGRISVDDAITLKTLTLERINRIRDQNPNDSRLERLCSQFRELSIFVDAVDVGKSLAVQEMQEILDKLNK